MTRDYNKYIITNYNVVLSLVIYCVNIFFLYYDLFHIQIPHSRLI